MLRIYFRPRLHWPRMKPRVSPVAPRVLAWPRWWRFNVGGSLNDRRRGLEIWKCGESINCGQRNQNQLSLHRNVFFPSVNWSQQWRLTRTFQACSWLLSTARFQKNPTRQSRLWKCHPMYWEIVRTTSVTSHFKISKWREWITSWHFWLSPCPLLSPLPLA